MDIGYIYITKLVKLYQGHLSNFVVYRTVTRRMTS